MLYYDPKKGTMQTVLSYHTQKGQIQNEYLSGLRQRKIDDKFSYIGKRQAASWLGICNSGEYGYYKQSKKLLQETIKDFIEGQEEHVNVIALGPGNAVKEKVVVEAFQQNHQVDLFFVDISRDVITLAVESMENDDALKEIFIADLKDFESIKEIAQFVRDHYNATSFFTLLGNTLGNYPQPVILKTIREAMRPGDSILLDVSCIITPSDNDSFDVSALISQYDNENEYERILACLSEAGIEAIDGAIEVEFNRDKIFTELGVIEQYFRFNHSKVITYKGESMYFGKNERILVGYSNKYTLEALDSIFYSHGISLVKHVKNDAETVHQILCELV